MTVEEFLLVVNVVLLVTNKTSVTKVYYHIANGYLYVKCDKDGFGGFNYRFKIEDITNVSYRSKLYLGLDDDPADFCYSLVINDTEMDLRYWRGNGPKKVQEAREQHIIDLVESIKKEINF